MDMNHKLASTMFALAGTLALACVGCTQNPGGQQQQQPAPGTTAQMPPPPPSYMNGQPQGSDMNGPPEATGTTAAPMPGTPPANGTTGASGQGGNFEVLAGGKGYVTRQAAQQDPWLASHFSQCDTNHDDKITRQEYTQCRQQQGNRPAQP